MTSLTVADAIKLFKPSRDGQTPYDSYVYNTNYSDFHSYAYKEVIRPALDKLRLCKPGELRVLDWYVDKNGFYSIAVELPPMRAPIVATSIDHIDHNASFDVYFPYQVFIIGLTLEVSSVSKGKFTFCSSPRNVFWATSAQRKFHNFQVFKSPLPNIGPIWKNYKRNIDFHFMENYDEVSLICLGNNSYYLRVEEFGQKEIYDLIVNAINSYIFSPYNSDYNENFFSSYWFLAFVKNYISSKLYDNLYRYVLSGNSYLIIGELKNNPELEDLRNYIKKTYFNKESDEFLHDLFAPRILLPLLEMALGNPKTNWHVSRMFQPFQLVAKDNKPARKTADKTMLS